MFSDISWIKSMRQEFVGNSHSKVSVLNCRDVRANGVRVPTSVGSFSAIKSPTKVGSMKGIVKHRPPHSDQCLATEPLTITRQDSVPGFFIYLTSRVRRFALRLRRC